MDSKLNSNTVTNSSAKQDISTQDANSARPRPKWAPSLVSRLFSNQGQRHEDEEAEELCHENRGHQQQNTAMASKYNKLQELNRKLVAKSTNLEYENKALKSENMNIMQQNHDLDFDYRKLSQDYKMLYDGYMALLTDHEGTDAQISALIAEKAKLNERLTAFRQMLVPAAEGQVSDSEIVRKFGTIRSQIMGLVRQNWMIQLKQNIRLSDATKEQADFFGGLECTSTNLYWKHCPYERLQQEVSRLLLNTIFNRRPYFLSADYRGIQSYLAAAEKAIWESVTNLRDDKADLLEWRNVTMKVTECLRDKDHSLSLQAQHLIWDFLSVLELKSPDAKQRAKQKLQKLCDDAVDLSMMMRQAKDHIFVTMLSAAEGRLVSRWENMVDDVSSVPADSSHEPGTIAFVYSAVLYKSPKDSPMSMNMVLEKAEAVVHT